MATHDDTPETPERARRGRRTLALALAAAAAIEAALAVGLPEQLGRHEVDARVATVADPPPGVRCVLLADSVSYDVLASPPAGVLDLSTNQSVSTAGNAFLVERLVDAVGEGALERFVYVLSPTSFAADLESERFLEPYFTSIFTRPREREAVATLLARPALDAALAEHTGDPWLQPPSYRRRGYLTWSLTRLLRRVEHELHAGGSLPTEPTAAAAERIATDVALPVLAVSPVTAAFLPRLARAAGRVGAVVEVRLAPVPPTSRAAWEASGALPTLEAELRALCASEPNLSYGGAVPYAPPGDAAFVDGSHLHPVAERDYGAALAALLAPSE